MLDTTPANRRSLYEESPADVRVQERRKALRQEALVWLGAVPACLAFAWLAYADAPLFAFVALLFALGCAWLGWSIRNDLKRIGGHGVWADHLKGGDFLGGAIPVARVVRVESKRNSRQSGIFCLWLEDGQTVRIDASLLADADEFWKALKNVVANARGWEWGPEGRSFRE